MKLSDFVCVEAIKPELEAAERDEVIAELIRALDKAGKIKKGKCQEIIDAVVKREREASTGIGKGVAVPHVKHPAISEVIATIGCKSEGIDFSSLDKQPVYSVILLLSPADDTDKHLQAMENIFKKLQNDDFRSFLRQAQTVENVVDAIDFENEP